MIFRYAVLAVLAGVSARVLAAVAAVPAAGEECFVEVVEANNKLVGSFEVISGGLLDIEATVRFPRRVRLQYCFLRMGAVALIHYSPPTQRL